MKLSALVACTMALGTYAAALPVREPSGRLALRSPIRTPASIRADDVVERDTLSMLRDGHITRDPPRPVS
ncbi:hypothetical protein N0V82_006122 [Gnomoniopsis sp. IMI 355080]|nr:hypothetical protein N0V82_006122 [Gnomoniopsis sp. IMI 355080]